jgi:antitoxin (DNA-binding transcriptional repressor) of toxin-antitoxin stability system
MRDTYSLYDAKAQLSAIVRQVREGHPVIVTVHGEPAVEIRALPSVKTGIDAKLAQMAERGVLVRPKNPAVQFRAIARRPGALDRFLTERGE